MAMTAATLSSVMWKIDRLLGMLGSSGLSSWESVPVEEALNNLKAILPKLQSAADVVEEDEMSETVHGGAGEWMHKVKAIAYDAEDVLDDCEHELLLQLQLDAAARRPAAVGDSVSSSTAGATPVLLQIADIRRSFEGIMTEHAQTLNLRLEDIAVMPSSTILSPVPPPPDPIQPTVYGREDDKEKIVQLLLSSPPQQQHGGQHPPIIPVVGEQGIGKTTLCRLVYTDPRICEHFDFRIWASVSQQCLAKDAIAGYSYYREVGYLPYLLQWELTNKHFLLVVDDLEPEDLGFWESVYKHLSVGSRGSQVLLTSKTEEHLAMAMAAAMPSCYRLGYLTQESSWSLFKDYALRGRDHEVSPSLEAIGREIYRKCEGSPLLLKMMGALLHADAASKEKNWEKVFQSRCWKSKHRAIQAVPGLCFRRLPSHLRHCLVYCSLFPKGYPFTRDQLVRLWMAQDFLPPEEGKQMEDVGDDIVDQLLWYSFLAHPPIGEQNLVMSGAIHDLARSHLALTECSRKDDVEEISMDARHSSLLPCNTCNREIQLPSYSKSLHLKSYLLVKNWGHAGDGFYFPNEDAFRLKIPGDFFLPLGHLSSLDLSYSIVEELPESVGMLRHLRYLSLNHTMIKGLPESMSTLHRLWTLELRSCMRLRALPRAFNKLTSLRHLDTQKLRRSLFDIGELTNLRTLTSFIVARGRGSGATTISQLKHLGGLRGELHIIGLGQVLFAEEAEEAKLGNKELIEKLTLEWPGSFTCHHDHERKEISDFEEEEEFWTLFHLFDDDDEPPTSAPAVAQKRETALAPRERPLPRANRWFREEVFESLRPHPNLKHLVVESYSGVRLPSWMGDPFFSKLVSLTLRWCTECRALPPGLGLLPSLKQLTIKCFGKQRTRYGPEFEPIILKGFSSLEELQVEDMPWWEEWCGPEEEDGGSPLRLRSLTIIRCSRLKRLPQCLPPLEELHITDCQQFTGFPAAPSLVHLEFSGLANAHSDVKLCFFSWLGGLTALKSLSISGIGDFPEPPLPKLAGLRRLVISTSCAWDRRRPPSLLGLHDFVGLRRLEISFCWELGFLPEERLPSTLKVLRIKGCPLLRDWCLQQRSKLASVPRITLDGVSYDQVVQDAQDADQPQVHVP